MRFLSPIRFLSIVLLCVTCPVFIYAAPPGNDNCAAATGATYTLTSNTSCSNITFTLDQATPSASVPAGCVDARWRPFSQVARFALAARRASMATAFLDERPERCNRRGGTRDVAMDQHRGPDARDR